MSMAPLSLPNGLDRTDGSPVAALFDGLLCLAAILMTTVGANVLLLFGILYQMPGGPMPTKIHPSTYMVGAAFLVLLAFRTTPGDFLRRAWIEARSIVVFLACMLLLAAVAIARHGFSATGYIVDTLLSPGLFGLLLAWASPKGRQRVFMGLYAGLLLHAALSVGEVLAGLHLFPGLATYESEFRANGLLGLPLNSALALTPILVVSAYLALNGRMLHFFAFSLFVLGSLSFGARTATVVGLVGALCLATFELVQQLRRGTANLEVVILVVAMIIFGPVIFGSLSASGIFGTRVWEMLSFDDSSAETRFNILNVLQQIRHGAIWWGVSQDEIRAILGSEPDMAAIENFWVATMVEFGIAGLVPFVCGMVALFGTIILRESPQLKILAMTFIITASGNNSLASKTTCLSIFIVVYLIFREMLARKRREEEHTELMRLRRQHARQTTAHTRARW